jgi:hypothetical protein
VQELNVAFLGFARDLVKPTDGGWLQTRFPWSVGWINHFDL